MRMLENLTPSFPLVVTTTLPTFSISLTSATLTLLVSAFLKDFPTLRKFVEVFPSTLKSWMEISLLVPSYLPPPTMISIVYSFVLYAVLTVVEEKVLPTPEMDPPLDSLLSPSSTSSATSSWKFLSNLR
jgi:hypothetical protein